MDNWVGQADFFVWESVCVCTVFDNLYCSKCLCAYTMESNKSKKQQHNFIPHIVWSFSVFYYCADMSKGSHAYDMPTWLKGQTYFWWNWVQKPLVVPKETIRDLPWKFEEEKSSGSGQILGSGRLRQTNNFFFPNWTPSKREKQSRSGNKKGIYKQI